MNAPAQTGNGTPTLHLIATLLLVIAGLSALDRFLATTEMTEVRRAAERSYRRGSALLEKGDAAQALDPLRNAYAMEREDAGYETKLVAALVATGKTSEAGPLLEDLLQRKPDDGEANLIAARLMLKERNIPEAESYYHRAIYGEWPNDPTGNRIAARLELIRLLTSRGDRQELLSELISLEAESGGDRAIDEKLGRLFLTAGSPARAIAVYRRLLAKSPGDAAAYMGLGEAELETGDYRAARGDLLQASFHLPDKSLEAKLELLSQVTSLDPTPRKLTSMEKFNRSRRILQLASADLQQHIARNPTIASLGTEASAEATELLKQAADVTSKKTPPHVTNEMAEGSLDLAERIWKERVKIFSPSTTADEEPLRLIMEKLGA